MPSKLSFILVPLITFFSVFILFELASRYRSYTVPIEIIETPVVPTVTTITKQPPTRINISTINKDLPVQAALVKDNEWQLFDASVAWLATSSIPGEDGPVVLYAHNWDSLWGEIYKLVPGDQIELWQNEKVTIYTVFESRAVAPTDVSAILSTDHHLVLYTCEGAFDQKRRVVYAKPTHGYVLNHEKM